MTADGLVRAEIAADGLLMIPDARCKMAEKWLKTVDGPVVIVDGSVMPAWVRMVAG